MAVSKSAYTDAELQDQDAVDLVQTFVAVQARQWQRRTRNRILPKLIAAMDEERIAGNQPDMVALLRDIWLKDGVSLLAEQEDK